MEVSQVCFSFCLSESHIMGITSNLALFYSITRSWLLLFLNFPGAYSYPRIRDRAVGTHVIVLSFYGELTAVSKIHSTCSHDSGKIDPSQILQKSKFDK